MKGMNYSSLTAILRRIHQASLRSEKSGVPVQELLEQDKELRRRLQVQDIENQQRRNFIKTAGGFGLGASLLPMGKLALAGVNNNGKNKDRPSVGIIGAGAGGLRTAHRLRQYGWDSKIYESSERIGGRIYSNTDYFSDNRVVEWGGEFISTEHTAIRNLAHQLNLRLEDANKLSLGDEESYLISGQLYSEHDLMEEWLGGLYEIFKKALMDAPWQPLYNSFTPAHRRYDDMNAIEMLRSIGYSDDHWVHKLLVTDLVAEYGLLEENSALNLIYLLGWNVRSSGGLPLAGTDERLHVVGGNDQIMHGMANELPADTIQHGRHLVAIEGDHRGPYTLIFDKGKIEACDILVMAMPYNLIKDVEIDSRITAMFSEEKKMSLAQAAQSDNGKIQFEFSDRHWDRIQNINGRDVHQAARAYSDADKFISTWEGEPGNPSPLGVLVNYNGGHEARTAGGKDYFGVASKKDVSRGLKQFEQVWPGIKDKYTGKALVSNWWDNPLSRGAFTSPTVRTMTYWWGAQWETEGNMYFAGEACDEELWSYMDGAIRSGERVALEIAQR